MLAEQWKVPHLVDGPKSYQPKVETSAIKHIHLYFPFMMPQLAPAQHVMVPLMSLGPPPPVKIFCVRLCLQFVTEPFRFVH